MTADEVKRLRRRFGLTQVAFAKLVGTHPVTVSKWETGAWAVGPQSSRLMALLAKTQRPKRRNRR